MTDEMDESTVMAALSAGAGLVRVTSSKSAASWYLGPANTPIGAEVAEAVVMRGDVCCMDGPIGRMVWVYVLTSLQDVAAAARAECRVHAMTLVPGWEPEDRSAPAAEEGPVVDRTTPAFASLLALYTNQS